MAVFKEGGRVEVTMPGNSSTGPYIPAVVLRPPCDKSRTLASVEYMHRPLADLVDPRLLRPAPPPDPPLRSFSPGDKVDAFRVDSWFLGSVAEILGDSSYSIALSSNGGGREEEELIVCEHSNLRVHRDWNPLQCSWVPPLGELDQAESTCAKAKNMNKRLKLVDVRRRALFECGSTVEVTSEEEGYRGCWYAGEIIGSISSDKLLVEYRDLLADDNADAPPLREVAEKRHVRPKQPSVSSSCFEKLDRVDAWCNDGWWEGVISKVEGDGRYVVYFRSTNEEMVLDRSELRPHRDWFYGKWTSSASDQVEVNEEEVLDTKPVEFLKGLTVEVRSDEEGYQGSWYEAKIVESLGDEEKYTVEYQTLKTEDETEFLKEVAKALDIRPCPPKSVRRSYPYELLENVDCWYNEGWWVGHIWKVLGGRRYAVYFTSTKDELEFEHDKLRPHMEWIHGKWIYSHAL